jgi:hypothetical protein
MSEPGEYTQRLANQLAQAGINYKFTYDDRFSWRRMVEWQGEQGALHPNDLLIFVGGWDTLLMGTKKEIEELQWDERITFAGDKYCWPDDRITDYKKHGWPDLGDPIGPWRYLNTGPMMGLGWLIKEAVDWGQREFPLTVDDDYIEDTESGTDMRFWTKVHLDSPFGTQIDYKCRLGQTTLHEKDGEFSLRKGRVKNEIHGTYPIFLHLNGKGIAPEGLK